MLLGGLRLAAHIAALVALGLSILVAIIVYGMPVDQTLLSASEGAVFGLFPIMWIVWTAIWIYNMTEATGHFAVLRRAFSGISNDQRIQAVIIAFCFGALLEALAGFGTPVAITAVMLIAVGFQPMKAAAVALVANTAPVAFGAIAIPIVTLSGLTDIPKEDLGAMVGRQTPFLALIVPLILVGMVDGWRGVRAVWPAAIAGGLTFAVAQFVCSNYISVELTDIVASLLSAGAIIAMLRVWQPADPLLGERRAPGGPRSPARPRTTPATRRRSGGATTTTPTPRRTSGRPSRRTSSSSRCSRSPRSGRSRPRSTDLTQSFDWPGLDIQTTDGEAPTSATYNFNWANAAGTLLFVSGLLTMLVLRVSPGRAVKVFGKTLNQLKLATITVMSVLALAYVMNQSAQTLTIGSWIAGAGGVLAFFSSIIGWLGVAVTGSDTSSNSLFGVLQQEAAIKAGIDPLLLTAGNSSGGVLGKMVSPQNLAIGAAAVGLAGREGDLFRKVLGWSLLMLLFMCVLVYLQSTSVLGWMIP